MEGTEATIIERTGQNGGREVDQRVLMSSKPLHRFVQKEPKSIGIVIVIFGCAELLMGFQLASESISTSCEIYIPFWQGVLFLVSGSLSIYTEVNPSKKMVTICLAMYIVSIFGIVVSVGYRIHSIAYISYLRYRIQWMDGFSLNRVEQLLGVEGILFISSLCQSVLLIFLCVVARFALKSTHTQVIVQHIPSPVSGTASN